MRLHPAAALPLALGLSLRTPWAEASNDYSFSDRVQFWPLTTEGLSAGIQELTIDGLHDILFTGRATCRDITSAFLARIEAINPTINALINLDPGALDAADRIDDVLLASASLVNVGDTGTSGGNLTAQKPLLCVPVVLKDNFDAVGTSTTGGCRALADRKPQADATTVAALRDAGAIMLAKANLHELALEGLSVSSLGGQTRNPYDITRTPGGSSGGTGAALAANLAVIGTGTDTVNSLRSPASANNLVSLRPTRGLLSRAGVIPVSYTQDAVGPMARTVKDLAVALTVMARIGFDPVDNMTAAAPPETRSRDYVADMNTGPGLRGLRLGALNGFWNHTMSDETTPVNTAMDGMIEFLESQGAQIVNVTESIYNATDIASKLDVQRFEYRELLTEYLEGEGTFPKGAPRSFHELYGGDDFVVIPSEYEYVNTASVSSTSNASYAAAQLGIRNLTLSLQATFARHGLDALIYPEQKNLVVPIGAASQSGRNGILAALTGSPVVTVPAGFSPPTPDAPVGVPVGMEILGRPFTEGRLLNMAEQILRSRQIRRIPALADLSVEVQWYDKVPEMTSGTREIPGEYPMGALS